MSTHADQLIHAPEILEPIAQDMAQVNEVIKANLSSEVALINQIGQYIINAGGKRLRPALLLLTCAALNPTPSEHRHLLAAVVEFIHTATLLHDDVVDESVLRRGKETANARFGNAASVLVGDYLYSKAFEMMVSTNNMRVMSILSEATTIIAEGEVLQLLNMHDANVNEQRYMHVIRYKTAKLFEAAARLGAVINHVASPIEIAAAEFGGRIGTAFQIMDDWLDYAGSTTEMGKNSGDDLREGKPTLPLIYLMENGTAKQAKMVRSAIEQGGTSHFSEIYQAITESNALEHTLQRAQQEAQAAIHALQHFPESIFKEHLIHLCHYAVSRLS